MKKFWYSCFCFVLAFVLLCHAAYPALGVAVQAEEQEARIQWLQTILDEEYGEQNEFSYTILDGGNAIRYEFYNDEEKNYTIRFNFDSIESISDDFADNNILVAQDAIQAEKKDMTDKRIVREDISLRGEYEKHFVCEDDSMLAVSYPEAVHQKTMDGSWEEIDNTLVLVNNKLHTKHSDVAVSFAENASETDLISIAQNGHTLSWQLKNPEQTLTVASKIRSLFSNDTATVKGKVLSDDLELHGSEQYFAQKKIQSGVRYNNLMGKDIDVEYTVLPGKIKENIILNKKSTLRNYTMSIQTNDLTPVLTTENGVDFLDNTGNCAFVLRTPYMYDAADEISYKISIHIEATATGFDIVFTPDAEWLSDSKREYPIVIDPTVTTPKTTSNTIDTYVYDGCSASSARANEEKLYIGMKPVNSEYKGHRVYWKAKQLPSISIPAAITNATFYMRCFAGTSTSKPFTIYSAKAAWDPATLTWANKPSGIQLQTAVNRDSNTNLVTFNSADLTNMVRDWYSGRNGNKGFIIKYTNESLSNLDYNSFYSSENTTSANYMPYLVVGYEAPTRHLEDGVYTIRNAYSNRYLTMMFNGAGSAPETNAKQYVLANGSPIQQWQLTYDSAGFYWISPCIDSGKRLDLHNASDADGTNIKTHSINNNDAQKFRLIARNGTNRFSLMPKTSTTRVVETDGQNTENGVNVQVWRYAGMPHQEWVFEKCKDTIRLIYHSKKTPYSFCRNINEGDSSKPKVWLFEDAPDFACGDQSDAQMLNIDDNPIKQADLNRTESQHYNNMRNLFAAGSFGEMQKVLIGNSDYPAVDNMLDRFYSGNGLCFSDQRLTDIVQGRNSGYHKAVQGKMEEFIKEWDGDFDLLFYQALSYPDNSFAKKIDEGVTIPSYSSPDGLELAIHGWQSASIEVVSINETANQFDITLRHHFWDIFGLDDGDFSQTDLYNGFSSWYILQHKAAYNKAHRPFITYVTYEQEFTVVK